MKKCMKSMMAVLMTAVIAVTGVTSFVSAEETVEKKGFLSGLFGK